MLAVGSLGATVPSMPNQPRHCDTSTRRTQTTPVQEEDAASTTDPIESFRLSYSRRRPRTKPGCYLSSPRRPETRNWTVAYPAIGRLLRALKLSVDRNRRPGRFLSSWLAGRLKPALAASPEPAAALPLAARVIAGGFPEPVTRSPTHADISGLRRLAAQCGEDFVGGLLIHTGTHLTTLGDPRFLAVPLAKLWKI